MILGDGTVVPSYFSVESMGITKPRTQFNSFSLRQGEVLEIIYPTDVKSLTKTFREYKVLVQQRDGSGPMSGVVYQNCMVANLFGGTADRFRYSLRAQGVPPAKGEVVGDGSKVLLLCVNGETRRAYIVSGLNEESTTSPVASPEDKTLGHNEFSEFNGVRVEVNDTGEYTLTFNGATNNDGTPRSDVTPGAPGSLLKFSNDGSINIQQGLQSILLDTPNKKIVITSDQYDVKIDTTGTKLGDANANDAMYLGTSHRNLDQTMNTSLTTELGILSGLITALAASRATAVVAFAGA